LPKPAECHDSDLLAWAASIIAQAQGDRAYSQVTVHVEAGKITRVQRTDSYKPPAPGMTAKQTGRG